jgi:uncharacterized membrane protein
MNNDSKTRSIAKTVTYRISAIALLAALSYYYTGDAGEATTITILFNAGGMVIYYALERLWDAIDWGRTPTRSGELKTTLQRSFSEPSVTSRRNTDNTSR